LLPEQFTLSELQSVYEVILEKQLEKRNFRRWSAYLLEYRMPLGCAAYETVRERRELVRQDSSAKH